MAWRWLRPTRAGLLVLLLVLAAVVVAARLGTPWTVPHAPASGAAYVLHATWDGASAPGGAFDRPIGIAVAPGGDVYVTDALQRVVRLNASGDVLGEWGREGDGTGEFGNPVGVAVASDGSVYVSDYEQDRVQHFTATGGFLAAFGRSGSGPGEFDAPAGLAVDDTGAIYVADFYNHRVQKFRPGGVVEATIGLPGRLGPGALHYPTGVAITRDREVLVADAYNYQLQWFDRDGGPLRRVGYHLFWIWPRPVTSTSGFSVPTDAAVGPNGVIHVADSGNRRVVMLSPAGALLTEWRIPDANPAVFSPEHLALSPDGTMVYATDLGGNRVLVLRVTTPLTSKSATRIGSAVQRVPDRSGSGAFLSGGPPAKSFAKSPDSASVQSSQFASPVGFYSLCSFRE